MVMSKSDYPGCKFCTQKCPTPICLREALKRLDNIKIGVNEHGKEVNP